MPCDAQHRASCHQHESHGGAERGAATRSPAHRRAFCQRKELVSDIEMTRCTLCNGLPALIRTVRIGCFKVVHGCRATDEEIQGANRRHYEETSDWDDKETAILAWNAINQ